MEKLAPQLVSAALRVRQTPKDSSCSEHLGQLRRDWTAKIHALTSVVDDVTDFNDFVLMTGMFNLSFPVPVVGDVRRQVLRIPQPCSLDLMPNSLNKNDAKCINNFSAMKRIWMASSCFVSVFFLLDFFFHTEFILFTSFKK